MQAIICPKCGFRQKQGTECHRCGIIFSRYNSARNNYPATTEYLAPVSRNGIIPLPEDRRVGLFRRIYRGTRWAILAALLCVVVLILRPAPPPSIVTPADAAQRAVDKVQRFRNAAQRGRQDTLEMDESELNGWLQDNLAFQRSPRIADLANSSDSPSPAFMARKALSPISAGEPGIEQAETSVRDIIIELRENTLLAYVVFTVYGMDLTLELEGCLIVDDGHLRLDLTSGRLGSLPLLAGTLEGASHRLFDDPQNREKFRLPPHIKDLRIEGGRLIVTSK